MLKKIVSFFLLSGSMCLAQLAGSGAMPPQTSAAPAQVPLSYALSQTLLQIDQTAQNAVVDLSRVRIDKWKTDDKYKEQSRANVESLTRNLTSALPTLVEQVRTNPSSLAPLVKLYRNLNALYDVLASLTESTGAFGSKDDYRMLASDAGNLDTVRRSIAEQLEQMAANHDAQIGRLTAQVRAQQAAVAAAPPKRVVVDDATPAKKTSTKKKPAAQPTQTKTQ